MAAVQDGLWLLRTKPLLEVFSGSSQLGGKHDAVTVSFAVILHLQMRSHQGLDTYLPFADLKWAYDTADQDAMLVSSYFAGIIETEWLLLFDFFFADGARVCLGGFLSDVLSFRAGIPRGRKFVVHTFTTLMVLLKDLLVNSCLFSRFVLPPFAADAISTPELNHQMDLSLRGCG